MNTYKDKTIITVNARKFNNKIHRSWKAELSAQTDLLIELTGVFETEVTHNSLGVIRRGTVSYEYYWLDRWFNVFRFHEPEGELRNYYCNINLPPTFNNLTLDYTDLEIDVLVWPDFNFSILDREEFESTAAVFGFSRELIRKTEKSLAELLHLITERRFPFDFDM